MSLSVSQRTLTAAEAIQKTPVLVLCIDGLDTKYGTSIIFELIRIGDPGLLIDGSWVIGGLRALDNQEALLSMSDSTNTIRQTLDVDKGRGSTISSMELGLVDFDNKVTELIAPGLLIEDILGAKAQVFMGFEGVPFSEYNLIFRGNVDDIKSAPSLVKINLAHPDNKKRQLIAPKTETKITAAINNSQTTGIILEDADELISPSADPDFESYVRIEDEIIKFTGITMSNELTGVVRGMFNTTAVAHAIDSDLVSFYVLQGTAMQLALKVMLSNGPEYWAENVEIQNFVQLPDASLIDNAIYFEGVDIPEKYGVTVGDFCTVTGASNGANNFVDRTVVGIIETDTGYYIQVDGAALVVETDSAAVIKFKSRFATLPIGLGMSPDEVDVTEHLRIEQLFLSSFEYKFYLKESIDNAQDWLEQEVYKPASAYSLPRRARSSVGFLSQPIPSEDSVTITSKDVVKPQNLTIRRTTAKAFFNHIVYKFEQDSLEDKFLRGRINRSQTSIDRIKVGTKALVIESQGMRESLNATNLADLSSDRRLKRYQFGAEFFENVELTFGKGFRIEIGDVILFDPDGLKISDSVSGTRDKPIKLYSVENKTMNLKTGQIQLHIVDTSYDNQARYALYGPASRIRVGLSATQFIIEPIPQLPATYGTNEWQRWSRFPNVAVKIRSEDFTTRFFQTTIANISGNTITVSDPLGFTPQTGDMMELADYDFAGTTDQIKLLYGYMQDAATFPSDGKPQYQYL